MQATITNIYRNRTFQLFIFIITLFCASPFVVLADEPAVDANEAAAFNDDKVDFNYTAGEGLQINFTDLGSLQVSAEAECGFQRDGAVYASFGLEAQILQCAKIIIGLEGDNAAINSNSYFFFKLDLAPLYESIAVEDNEPIDHITDSEGRRIDGNNFYVDWYKNLGSRLYYLGDVPIIEAVIGYKSRYQQVKFGRMKTIIGFHEEDTFFQDDAKFAPMGYWLSKDLFTGLNYAVNYQDYVSIDAAIYSGGNPTKGYSNYLNHIETPNRKSNNTPTYAVRVNLGYNDDLVSSHFFASYMSHITGSTWSSGLGDGKRNAHIQAYGGGLEFMFDNLYFNSVRFFGQYTVYMSGLRENSAQNDNTLKFKDLTQDGFFIGSDIAVYKKRGRLGVSYERMDRFDYNVYRAYGFSESNPYKNAQQQSLIVLASYKPFPFATVKVAYHKVWDPVPYVSKIADNRSDYRIKVALQLQL